MRISANSTKQDYLVFYIGCAVFCALIIGVTALAIRSQRVDEGARTAVHAWLARKNDGATVVLTDFQHRPGFKGKAIRVEYTVNGRPAKKSPRYLLIRRGLTGPWSVAYEIDEKQYLKGPTA